MNNDYGSNIKPHILSEKELKDQELINLHITILKEYMSSQLAWNSKQKANAMKLYDEEIDRSNIRHYYNRHVGLFLLALTQDKLESIAQYNIVEYEDEDE